MEFRMIRKFFTITLPILLFVIFAFYFTSLFITPAPKKEITIAAGSKTGQYYYFATQYKKLLEEEKIKVNILETKGSVENIKLIEDGKADIGFVQNGIIDNSSSLEFLANIYYEPLWIFYKNEGINLDYVINLIGKKISIGKVGSGTNYLASQILETNGISTENTTVYNYTDSQSVEKLKNGEIDAIFIVGSANSSEIQTLLNDTKVNLFSVKRARAYKQKFNFLYDKTLYEGTMNLYNNIPYENVNLLATTATLVTNKNTHSELIRILLKKVSIIHQPKTLFSQDKEFPNGLNNRFAMNEEAQKYLKNGDTWLEDIFPYWIAANLDRLKILLIPLLTLMFPLFKGVLPLYTWSMRSKIYRWYKIIRKIDLSIPNATKEELLEKETYLEKLRIEIQEETHVPLSFMREYYDLFVHIDLIKNRVEKHLSKKAIS